MDQWEHMIVQAVMTQTSQELVTIGPAGTDVLDRENANAGRVVRALNELGTQGWELVGTDHLTVGSGEPRALSSYYMKRRKPHS